MNQQQLVFQLNTGWIKLFSLLFIFCSLIYLSFMIMPPLWAGCNIIVCGVLTFIFRSQNPVLRFAYLADDDWTVQFKQTGIQHLSLISVQSFGYFIFLQFSDVNQQQKYSMCIAKDQLNTQQWRYLRTITRLF